jgi:hypothetical protein
MGLGPGSTNRRYDHDTVEVRNPASPSPLPAPVRLLPPVLLFFEPEEGGKCDRGVKGR